MAFTGSMEDKLAVRELYDSYGDASCTGDINAFLSFWTEDAEWGSCYFQCRGKAELKTQWEQLWANFENVTFLTNILSIEIDGDSASVRSVAREIVSLKAGGLYKLSGLYEDRLVRKDGVWLYQSRQHTMYSEEHPSPPADQAS